MYKILFVSTQFPTPHEKYRGIFNLNGVKQLIEMGNKVYVVSPTLKMPSIAQLFRKNFRLALSEFINRWSTPETYEVDGIDVYSPFYIALPKKLFWVCNGSVLKFLTQKKILKKIAVNKPDVIVNSELWPGLELALGLKSKVNVPLLSIMIGSDILIQPDRYRGWKEIKTKIDNGVDLNICVSEEMIEVSKSQRQLKNLKLLHNGFDSKSFFIKPEEVDRSRSQIKLVSVGHFQRVKGHDILLEAMKIIESKHKGLYTLSLRGDGDLYEAYAYYVKAHNLENVVRFVGPIDNLRSFLVEHDFFILPSRSEGLPAAPLEAMACGLPVISSNVGGMLELIDERQNGLFFEKENSEDLANKIIDATQNEWDRFEISNTTRARYGWDSWANTLVSFINEFKDSDK